MLLVNSPPRSACQLHLGRSVEVLVPGTADARRATAQGLVPGGNGEMNVVRAEQSFLCWFARQAHNGHIAWSSRCQLSVHQGALAAWLRERGLFFALSGEA